MRRVELSHVIGDGTPTYPGLPEARICDFWTRAESAARYADGSAFHIAKLEIVSNTGTYIDAPFHLTEDGVDVADLSLASCTELPGLCIPVDPGVRAIDASCFQRLPLAGHAVLVHTGWDQHFGTEAYGGDHPYLTLDAALLLRDEGAALVGIDSVNIDYMRGDARPVHSTLLSAGIPIVEHLCDLDQLPINGFDFSAAPARFRGVGSFPVRAYATIED